MSVHIPVLKDEILSFFRGLKGTYLDATLGYSGHSKAILDSNDELCLIACDQDDEAIAYSTKKLENYANRVKIHKCNYEKVFSHIENKDDLRAVLADIGVSSLQLDKNERGFSYDSNELDMRMNQEAKLDAKAVINEYSEQKLSEILCEYGELAPKLAADLAKKIIAARPINSCKELSQIIGNAKLKSRQVAIKTLVFQAIRIEVNDELGVLKRFLEQVSQLKNCYVCIITFHSLEDKIVKDCFKSWANPCICDPHALRCVCGKNHALGKIITKKPITPSKAEIAANSRSSCAKLRVFYLGDE